MKRVKHLGVSAIMGKVYYGSIAKDDMGWLSDKTEVPKSEFIQAIFDWVKHESEGTGVVVITKFGKAFAEISVKYQSTHLCDTCSNEFAECGGNKTFGDGIGNDNVTECTEYDERGDK